MAGETILIIEDDPDILELLRYNLDRHKYKVLVESNGEQGLQIALHYKPDLIILDIMLPGSDGYQICKKLRANNETLYTPIIVLTAKVQESDVIVGLELGCDDYITKPFSPRELLARIKALLRRRQFEEIKTTIQLGSLSINKSNYEVSVHDKMINMTLTEFKILSTLASDPGRVFNREQLLNQINDGHITVIERNIDVHIRSLRKKLAEESKMIQTVRGVGYKCQIKDKKRTINHSNTI